MREELAHESCVGAIRIAVEGTVRSTLPTREEEVRERERDTHMASNCDLPQTGIILVFRTGAWWTASLQMTQFAITLRA